MPATESNDPRTGVRIFECESWDDFIVALRKVDGRCQFGHIYRGHARADWLLSSPVERHLHRMKGGDPSRNVNELFSSPESYESFRRGRIVEFKDLAHGLPGTDTISLDEIDWLALARHHGMFSYLLDWTLSPYVAAFFAFMGAVELNNPGLSSGMPQPISGSTEPVAVWALGLYPDLEVKREFDLVSSRHQINYWQKAQRGLFSTLKHDVWVDVESYLASRGMGRHLEKYLIPGNSLGAALADLERMNVNYSTLFPDFRGAALRVNVGDPWRIMSGH